jgi:hypothetical protein
MKVEENTGMTGRRPSTYFQPRVEMLVNSDKAGMTGNAHQQLNVTIRIQPHHNSVKRKQMSMKHVISVKM